MSTKKSQHESVRPSHPKSKQRTDAQLRAAGYSRQKVRDVIEESTTSNWQQHMAGGATRLAGLFAFLSCVMSAEVQK